MTPGKERGWDMFKLKEKILRFGGQGDSCEEPMVGKGSGQLWGCCLSHHPLRRLLLLAQGHCLPHKGCHNACEAGLRRFPMKVNESVLNWIQMEKPEVWWHLVPVAPYAAGPCPVFAVCGFIASGMSH